MRRTLLLIALVGLAAPAGAQAGAVSLNIRYDDGAGNARRATLTCDGEGSRATGFLRHRNAARLCARAYTLERFLGRAPDNTRACTEVFGGPDRAVIRGNIRGTAVARRFGRSDGCEIADWDRAQRLLPRPVGAT